VTVGQKISAPPEKEGGERRGHTIPDGKQYFYVVSPKFVLPPDSVDSTYPANGGSVEATILPHIVFRDPHLPWARPPTWINIGQEKANELSRTPWVALLTFTVDELQLPQSQLDGILKDVPDEVKRVQTETLAVKMPASNTSSLGKGIGVTNAIYFDTKWDAPDADKQVDVIFLKRDLFLSLFRSDDAASSAAFDVSKYRYMSHVRQVATDGMAVGGADSDEGLFGITVSHRTGPIGEPTPVTTVVHLVSLAMDKNLTPAGIPDDKDHRVSVISLHSWTYNCLPSVAGANSLSRLQRLGAELNVLHPQNAVPSPPASAASIEDVITKRQNDGYTLVRYRTITGDTTAGIYRGPLTPTFVPRWPREKKVTMQSNFGTDLQILDLALSLMDLTYASAWQLGKTLAMGDEAFSAALSRLRNTTHGSALGRSKADVHSALGTYSSRAGTALRMCELVQGLNQLNDDMHRLGGHATAADSNRWDYSCSPHPWALAPGSQHVDISMHSPHISTRIAAHADAVALSALTTADGKALYNEHNAPSNVDMAHVYSWVLDKLHFDNIPAHYLLPDPGVLPQETLRFFYVDENWTDALIDGALSLANYWGQTPEEDFCRIAIKSAINERLKTPDPALGGWHVQMPQYGFLLRSQLLVQFPDLAVGVEYSPSRTQPLMRIDGTIDTTQPQPEQARILVQKRLSDDTMYCLFDCVPPDIVNLTFTLPPHQQCFVIGQELDPTKLIVSFKKQYTEADPKKRVDKKPKEPLGAPVTFTQQDGLFDWPTRTVRINSFVDGLFKRLTGKDGFYGMDPSDYTEPAATSAMLALQLNDPILQLEVAGIQDQQVLDPAAPSSSRERFQLSVPEKPLVEPPLLKPVSTPRPTSHGPILRPRPRSPRPEAALVTEYVAQAKAIATAKAKAKAKGNMNGASNPKLSPYPGISIRIQRPVFKLQVYTLRERDFVPSNSPVPLDLIFSIRFDEDSPMPMYSIFGFHIQVLMGKTVPADPDEESPLFDKDINPPPPTMLSNMRFNVIKDWYLEEGKDGKRQYLMLNVIPRSSNGVKANMVHDASFLLSRAQIIKYEGAKTRWATVSMRYTYHDESGDVRGQDWVDTATVYIRPT